VITVSDILRTFTFDRNAFRRSGRHSADTVAGAIQDVESGGELSKNQSNNIAAMASFLGIFDRDQAGYRLSTLGRKFKELFAIDELDAWRWLITRALWLFQVPNGTRSAVNEAAEATGLRFLFFRQLVSLLFHLAAHSGDERFLYYGEFCALMQDDQAWAENPHALYYRLMTLRPIPAVETMRPFLGELEDEYGIPRDNLNGFFNNLLDQTGLFEYRINEDGKKVGMALAAGLDQVLNGRVRFIIEHAVEWEPASDWIGHLANQQPDLPLIISPTGDAEAEYDRRRIPADAEDLSELASAAHQDLLAAGVRIERELLDRYLASLLAKPFVILSGLSGSGKTLLAQSFAQWIVRQDGDYTVIPVGANWASGEELLGYPDALNPDRYVKRPGLEIVLRAHRNHTDNTEETRPHFLILDEMNLSYVERYFAQLLSTMESGEEVQLHSASSSVDDVPPTLSIPSNLFVIGTVNVDETTYMFSPKVLDRANVIEFRSDIGAIDAFLANPTSTDLSSLSGKGREYGPAFARSAGNLSFPQDITLRRFRDEASILLELLQSHETEFGYRTASEMARFLQAHRLVVGAGWSVDNAIDAQLLQKLLPKLHGSRQTLEPLLCALGIYCYEARPGSEGWVEWATSMRTKLRSAASMRVSELHPLAQREGVPRYPSQDAAFKQSFEKILRLLQRLVKFGFASFAEA
jgi:hypothetical protein